MELQQVTKEEQTSQQWCIYSRLNDEEKKQVNSIVSNCLERNGFAPEDPWWEMNYLLPDEN